MRRKITAKQNNTGTVLVIGGAGYIGSVLTRRLLNRGVRVRVLDTLLYKNTFAVEALCGERHFEFVKGDIRDRDTLAAAAEGVTNVVLLAALVGDPISRKYPELTWDVNFEGAKNAFDVMSGRNIDHFIFLSTCSNYGLIETQELATEETELNPKSVYAETKVAFEKFLREHSDAVDFSTTILRAATAYGLSPRMRFDLTVAEFTREIFYGRTLEVYDKDTWRPYCHVDDISDAIIRVAEAPANIVRGQVFNVGGTSENYTKQMIVENIQRHINADVVYSQGGVDPRNYRVNFDKIEKALGFTPSHSVAKHVPDLLRALENGLYCLLDDVPNYYRSDRIFI